MFAVIRENRDRSITRLLTCGSLEAVIVASQLEKNKVPLQRSDHRRLSWVNKTLPIIGL